MKLVLDDIMFSELKEYLLDQDGIEDVTITNNELEIKYNDKTSPKIIMKHINLFQKYDFSNILSFNKNQYFEVKILKYLIKDMCCEYCYKGLVGDLFNNEHVNAVSSNYDKSSAFDIEFTIEYDSNYQEDELIEYIKEKY